MEPGEYPEEALRRELQEELAIEVGDLTPLPVSIYHNSSPPIKLIPFLTSFAEEFPLALKAHIDVRWIDPSDWKQLDWAPADVLIIQHLLETPSP